MSGNGGGLYNTNDATLTNVTVAADSATGRGGGVYDDGFGGDATTIRNTLVANNSAPTDPDVAGVFISTSSDNLIENPESASGLHGGDNALPVDAQHVFTLAASSPTAATAALLFEGSDAGFDASVNWNGIALSPADAFNVVPTLSSFSAEVDTGLEDSEIEITFAELAARGDENDADGTVDAFVVHMLGSGTSSIGADSGSATAWAAGSNDVIGGGSNAYWTPDADVNGTLNAFSVVARDNVGALPVGSVTVPVEVIPQNDEQVLAVNTGAAVVEGSSGNPITAAQLATTDVDNAAADLGYTLTAVPADGVLRLGGTALGAGDTADDDLRFTVSDVVGGRFELVASPGESGTRKSARPPRSPRRSSGTRPFDSPRRRPSCGRCCCKTRRYRSPSLRSPTSSRSPPRCAWRSTTNRV